LIGGAPIATVPLATTLDIVVVTAGAHCVVALGAFVSGAETREVYSPGHAAVEVFMPGDLTREVFVPGTAANEVFMPGAKKNDSC
jgi:hypothetical protein